MKLELNENSHRNRHYALGQLVKNLTDKIDKILHRRQVAAVNADSFKLSVIQNYLNANPFMVDDISAEELSSVVQKVIGKPVNVDTQRMLDVANKERSRNEGLLADVVNKLMEGDSASAVELLKLFLGGKLLRKLNENS